MLMNTYLSVSFDDLFLFIFISKYHLLAVKDNQELFNCN